MKLVFKKNENGDVSVTMFKGTAEAQFSYIEMIKALLAGEALDRDYDESISKEEQTQINNVLNTKFINCSCDQRKRPIHITFKVFTCK